MFMTRREYAQHRGCDPKAVDYAIARGRIQLAPDGRIESTQADRDWDEHTDVLRSRPLPRSAGMTGVQADGGRQPKTLAFLEKRTEREGVMIALKTLELELRRGNLVPRSEVEQAQKAVFEHVRALRESCLQIPDRMAPLVAAESDPVRVRELLDLEIRKIFGRFAAGDKEAAA
jgi:hypothetical protein